MANRGKLQFEKAKENNDRSTSKGSAVSKKDRPASTASVASHRKSGAFRGGGGDGFKVPKYQNTYRLEPHLPFRFEVSDRILRQVMMLTFGELNSYNPETAVQLIREATADILDRLYKTDFDRVKYIVTLTLIENACQSFQVAHGRLWDIDRDNYSVHVIEHTNFFAYGTVHAINYE